MTIRAKLILSILLLLAGSLGAVSYTVVVLRGRQLREESEDRLSLVMSALKTAARESLRAQRRGLPEGFASFLREQVPELATCRFLRPGPQAARAIESARRGGLVTRVAFVGDPQRRGGGLMILAGIDEGVLRRRLAGETRGLSLGLLRLGAAVLCVGALLAWAFALSLTRPLRDLHEAAGKIAGGKLGVRLEQRSRDEIGSLVEVFNRMSSRLSELDEMKGDFVSSVTHELRSPLGSIESFLCLIERRAAEGKQAGSEQFWEYFSRIKSNVRRLSGFINDLLDVANIERGRMECRLEPARLQDIVEEVVLFFEARCRDEGVSLENRVDPGLPGVQGDPERLRQVFVNLISNALKFTPSGGHAWVSARRVDDGGTGFVEVAVADDGCGMDEEDCRVVFDKFRQGKSACSTARGPRRGTGLGLFIVKSIVEAHGGRVTVRSAPGKGSQFIFHLRLA